jgi:cytochrome b561
MQLHNTKNGYGWINIALHWLMAALIIEQAILGLYMTSLTYYDPLYRTLPWWHKSIGIVFASLLIARLVWRLINTSPEPHTGHKRWEISLASLTHRLFYLALFIIVISGYLISTADGRGIEVFGWLTIPATLSGLENQEDIAGDIHLFASWFLIGLVVLHAGGALKHHFLDRDSTLRRMIKPVSNQNPTTKEVEHETETT